MSSIGVDDVGVGAAETHEGYLECDLPLPLGYKPLIGFAYYSGTEFQSIKSLGHKHRMK